MEALIPDSDDEDIADPFKGKRFSVCTFLQMEVITVSKSVDVVQVDSLIKIPSELQVRQAISKLHEKQEEFPDKFSYIKISHWNF